MTQDDSIRLMQAWDALDACMQRVETAALLQTSGPVIEMSTERIYFRSLLRSMLAQGEPDAIERLKRQTETGRAALAETK